MDAIRYDTGRHRGASFVALTAMALVGCTSATGGVADSGDGDSSTGAGSLPDCTPREAIHSSAGSPISGFYTYAALPIGSCGSAAACSLGVYGPCFGNPEYVGYPINQYECRCDKGVWSCSILVAGGAACDSEE